VRPAAERGATPPSGSGSLAQALPRAAPGQAIGLLGGSFDPPHEGHAHITREALKRFRLDAVWWLVSPGNPLKARGPAPLATRMAAARDVMRHPRVHITDAEARLGTRYTAETLAALQRVRPRLRFVWLMGADNLAQFHRWERWEWILSNVPVGVLARPGHRLPARASPAAARFARARLPARDAPRLPRTDPPAWCFVNVPMRAESSTEIRARGAWGRDARSGTG
jgi:nicotinate-nucleotide adenylyltransferase